MESDIETATALAKTFYTLLVQEIKLPPNYWPSFYEAFPHCSPQLGNRAERPPTLPTLTQPASRLDLNSSEDKLDALVCCLDCALCPRGCGWSIR